MWAPEMYHCSCVIAVEQMTNSSGFTVFGEDKGLGVSYFITPKWVMCVSLSALLVTRDEQRCSLEHKWTFEGHQLGVVSVAADPTGSCKELFVKITSWKWKLTNTFFHFNECMLAHMHIHTHTCTHVRTHSGSKQWSGWLYQTLGFGVWETCEEY